MKLLDLKPTHKAITAYYAELQQLAQVEAEREGAVSPAFANLLRHCARQFNWTLYEQYPLKAGNKNIYPDGALVDAAFPLPYGYWEAKKTQVALEEEIRQKFERGYPRDNILFQTPTRAILYQDGKQRLDHDLTQPEALVEILKAFFERQPPEYEEWQQAVEAFKAEVPKIGQGVLHLIERERQTNNGFKQALEKFTAVCREAINPNISLQAVEEMLIQHLMTERIFSKVFHHQDFTNMNLVAHEIENVVHALVFPHGGRHQFFKPLDRFYKAIEAAAATLSDFSQKQAFLNTVYEKFFQGFSVKVADTHGIVYTPQPIVQFMVNSIEEILTTEFGRSLSDDGVHILDPFVGTGNFIIHVMQKLRKTALPAKYTHELHCNEVMLLPYYIAALNIEHEYLTLTGDYQTFEGICFVDTFELAEEKQLGLFTAENTARVARQKQAPIFVILGNPPYNMAQLHVNDNNKNREYKAMDKRVRETYAKDSYATNKNALSDVYVKAFRWASDRIGDEGIVAFITNSGFFDGMPFDGMRKHLAQDFSKIYHLNLKGNARTSGERRQREGGNVFDDAIRVGVGITLLIRKKDWQGLPEIYIYSVEDYWKAKDKKAFLEKAQCYNKLPFKQIKSDEKYTWLTDGMFEEFETFIPMGTKETKASNRINVQTIFKNYGRGAETGRDTWAYNFSYNQLAQNMKATINVYNEEVIKYRASSPKSPIGDFVINNPTKISWSRNLRRDAERGKLAEFAEEKIRHTIYRPFVHQYLFLDRIMNQEPGQMPHFFPTPEQEHENRIICCTNHSQIPFVVQMTNCIPEVAIGGRPGQCFPFYTYDKDGRNRRENITDWALAQFRAQYQDLSGFGKPDRSLDKWDIFYYVYAILHHPQYRAKYAANLKRELPRIPFAQTSEVSETSEVFWRFADAGKQLAELHVNYEQQPKYPLTFIETGEQLDWRVKKMKLAKDRTQIIYNHFLTLAGIPPEAFEYKLGNRSALHWLIDQYQVTTDKRSGIQNDPNRADEPEYIVNLIQRVITVSVATVKIVNALPAIEGTD